VCIRERGGGVYKRERGRRCGEEREEEVCIRE
jgi:hypothetical protein